MRRLIVALTIAIALLLATGVTAFADTIGPCCLS